MKKHCIYFLIFNAFISFVDAKENRSGVYYQELKNLKEQKKYEKIFDEDANQGLSLIQADIENYKQLSTIHRILRCMFFAMDIIIVTPETMPLLYSYVQDLCEKNNVRMPTVFITRNKGFFNAGASKLFTSTGGIIIGQKLMKKATDTELEGVIAHEIGHIKYNHINKDLALGLLIYMITDSLDASMRRYFNTPMPQFNFLKIMLISRLAKRLLIGKRFEREADRFAYEAGKGDEMINFFEHLIKLEKDNEDHFEQTYAQIQENYAALNGVDYLELMIRYYINKGSYSLEKMFKWLYHKTPLGAHPSHESRIALIRSLSPEKSVEALY